MDGNLIHGESKDFFRGSSAFTRGLSSAQYNDQRVTVMKYVPEKQRWAVKLYQESFQGKEILVNEANLEFDHFAAYEMVPLPSHLKIRVVDSCGEALFVTRDYEKGKVIFEEYPMMLVNNGTLAFDSRWNLYFGTENERGANAPVLKAFKELSDGNQTEDYLEDATTLFNKMLKLSMGEEQARAFSTSRQGKDFVVGEANRIAGVLARWQSNSHGFPLRGSSPDLDSISALFRYASKMLHSCEPNCICTVDPREGVLSVRTLKAVKAGELITNSYMGIKPDFLDSPLQERRLRLRERGFLCVCSRCAREQDEIMREMAENVARARLAQATADKEAKASGDQASAGRPAQEYSEGSAAAVAGR